MRFNVLRYFCVSLYTQYLGIVHQKLHSCFKNTRKYWCEISSESNNFCDHYHVTGRQNTNTKYFPVHWSFGISFLFYYYAMSKLILDHNVLLFFYVSMYKRSSGNVHPFSKQNILLSIRVTYMNFVKFYA